MMKNKKILFLSFVFLSVFTFSQSNEENKKVIEKFQKELNESYLDKAHSPLRGDNFTKFKKHPFFPIDLKYRVVADFAKAKDPKPIDFPTSSGHVQKYVEYGIATFLLDGKSYSLTIYQNINLIKKEEYKDHLFLPFRDATNKKETYGGGRYIDLKNPDSDKIVIDFNQAYQPYCAYNAHDYSCPIVPSENTLPVKIKAGVKYDDVYH